VAVCTVHGFLVTLLKVFVEMLPVPLQYYLIFFFRKDHILFTVASALMMNLLFEICSPVDILLISKELKHWETNF
jgi:hypothetical protein